MLFHHKTRKAAGIGMVIIGILVIISMIILYFPALRY
jgi:hypothetical protein